MALYFTTYHTAFLEVSNQTVLQMQADRYGLSNPLDLARFLQDADIRLVRAKFGPQLLVIVIYQDFKYLQSISDMKAINERSRWDRFV